VTLTWKEETDCSQEICLNQVKQKLNTILNSAVDGFEDFIAQVEVAKMKDRKKPRHIRTFGVDEILDLVSSNDSKKEFVVDHKSYYVKMNSDRYLVFKNNKKCAACSLEGTKMILDLNPGDNSPHFNLYGEEKGKLVLMTKDHIIPKSKGGQDVLSNYQTSCFLCNNLKADYDLTYDQVRELRDLVKNEKKLKRKELWDLIFKTRAEMAKYNGETHDGK
jgi:5-methylcytosine-specific restriction endonuclease McrA